jgi:hypothetical protein
MRSTKTRLVTLFTLTALCGALVLANGAGAAQQAWTLDPERSYLVCEGGPSYAAALHFPTYSAPRFSYFAIRIDRGPSWGYTLMYFAHGRAWHWEPSERRWHDMSQWNRTWGPIWVPDDGRSHYVEVYESQSTDGRTYSPYREVPASCTTIPVSPNVNWTYNPDYNWYDDPMYR